MAEKANGGTSGAAGRAPSADKPDMVRNVVLVGHSGSGKTTLVEALLAATGTIPRTGRVEDGTTVSDFDEVEVRQQRSVNLALAPLTIQRDKDQPARHARLRRLRRRPAGRAAGRRRRAVRGRGHRRGRRADPPALGRVRERGHAARASSSPRSTISGPTSTRSSPPARTPSATAWRRSTCRWGARRSWGCCPGACSTTRAGPVPREPDADQVDADRAVPRRSLIEGIIQESEDEIAHGPLPRRRGDRHQGPHRRPGEGGRAGHLPPGPGDRAGRGHGRSCSK